MNRNEIPIIIGGCHRSGTSLVRRILNAHSRIFCGPEIKFLLDLHGGYINDPVQHGRFFASAQRIAAKTELLDLFGPMYVKMIQQAMHRDGKSRWADKNPENVIYLSSWSQLLGDHFVFVHVVRHPLDTLASVAEAGFRYAIPESLQQRIEYWVRYTEAGLGFRSVAPERYYMLRYDQLVTEPETTLTSLMEWLGESFEANQLNWTEAKHIEGLEDPKVRHTTRIHTNSLNHWKSVLSVSEAQSVWKSTSALWYHIAPDSHDPLETADSTDWWSKIRRYLKVG